MTSYQYKTYKFRYTDDLGRTLIKRQRSYLSANQVEQTPITSLFLARIVNFAEKVTGSSVGLRHCLAYVERSRYKANIPYPPGDVQLTEHLNEILAVERVICGDYWGETTVRKSKTNADQSGF